jgi:hypothetical protein
MFKTAVFHMAPARFPHTSAQTPTPASASTSVVTLPIVELNRPMTEAVL